MAWLNGEDVFVVRTCLGALFLGADVEELALGGYSLGVGTQGVADVAVLGAVLVVSGVLRLVVVGRMKREVALELYQQPSSIRAGSYALTCPVQVYLCAKVAGVRGAAVLGVMMAAQFVSSALVLALEVETASGEVEEAAAPVVAAPELQIGCAIHGPQADLAYCSTHRQRAAWSWVCVLTCSGVLHVCVWVVIFWNFVGMEAGVAGVHVLVIGQFVLLSLIWLVPLLHAGLRWTNAWSCQEEFVAMTCVHTVLDVTAKVLLSVAFFVA